MQTGEFIYDVTTARATEGSNFAAHSQGDLLIQSGVEYQNDNGGYQGQDQQLEVLERIEGVANFGGLFEADSPHSIYLCENHEGAKQNCGYRP